MLRPVPCVCRISRITTTRTETKRTVTKGDPDVSRETSGSLSLYKATDESHPFLGLPRPLIATVHQPPSGPTHR